jgi:hypothetical protein
MSSMMGPGQQVNFGPDIPPGDVEATFTEVAELHDEVLEQFSDLGRWALGWGALGVVFSLLLHGPVFFVASAVLCGAAGIAWLLSHRRFVAGTPQSRAMAWAGFVLGLLGLALAFAGLVGHPLFGLGWKASLMRWSDKLINLTMPTAVLGLEA